ncbi:hypothetical protein ACFE04_017071 [Oxalis oulophora]
MSLFVEEYSSLVIIAHFIYQAAVILTVLRWVLSWALNHRIIPPPVSLPSRKLIIDSLVLTTFGDIKQSTRSVTDTCAVCLVPMKEHDLVRELRNCCHVFHRECIDRWVAYEEQEYEEENENHKRCPLCRAPMLSSTQTIVNWEKNEPSWAVERILYLFGDDLLMSH